jgi:uncharacterized membrane protein YgdD (TMEM256/DUF423 family)
MTRLFVMLGSGLMFLGVAAGAFGAHGLSGYFDRNPGLAETFETAVRYQMIHSLALFVAAWSAEQWPGAYTSGLGIFWAGYLFAIGIVVFSGSLYALVFTKLSSFGAITPVGGLAFLAGWICLMLAAWRDLAS